MSNKFYDRLKESWHRSSSLLCVGLDPDPAKLPAGIASGPDPLFQFNKAIVDATADVACVYKPQAAFYAAIGAEKELEKTIHYIKERYPTVPVILDSKRGDIGNTAAMYAKEAFERYGADAVTVNPYLGFDSIEPFLKYSRHAVFLLCRTSNPGARDLQDLKVGTEPLYSVVARKAAAEWNATENLGLVVGATYPSELAQVRALVGDMPLLVPGIGAQGGDIDAAVRSGVTTDTTGLVINSSRQIIFASSGADFAEAARRVAIETRDAINRARV